MSQIASKWIEDFFVQEVPSGLVNGSNTSFTLANLPRSNSSTVLTLDGLILAQGVDYTISGSGLSLSSPPVQGQTLYCLYLKG